MAQKRTKIHHYVPKALQKHFCCQGEQIWYSERDDSGSLGDPELRNIKSTFKMKDYYTVLSENKPSDIVEREFYGKIDDYLGRVLPELFESFARGRVPVFKGKSLESLHNVVFQLIKRSPDFVKNYNDIEIGREIVERVLAEVSKIEPNGTHANELRQELKSDFKLKQSGRHVRVRSQISPSEKIVDELNKFVVRWAKSDGKHSIILSSMIAFRIGNGGPNGISNPNMEIWIPISPKLAMVLVRDPDNQIPEICVVGRRWMRQFNEFAVENSINVASHSRELVCSLLK